MASQFVGQGKGGLVDRPVMQLPDSKMQMKDWFVGVIAIRSLMQNVLELVKLNVQWVCIKDECT